MGSVFGEKVADKSYDPLNIPARGVAGSSAGEVRENILKAVEEGKTVVVSKTWTGLHVVGSRHYNNINVHVEVDDKAVFDENYPDDRFDHDEVDEKFNALVNEVYEKAYDKALELLLEKLKLGLEEFKKLEEKGEIEIFADEEGNIICRNEKEYAVVFTEYYRFDSAGKHITVYRYFPPHLVSEAMEK
jgi:hypothetical protein